MFLTFVFTLSFSPMLQARSCGGHEGALAPPNPPAVFSLASLGQFAWLRYTLPPHTFPAGYGPVATIVALFSEPVRNSNPVSSFGIVRIYAYRTNICYVCC